MPDLAVLASSSVVAAVIGALSALLVKRSEERRLRSVAALERDLKSAEMFVRLMNLANGKGDPVVLHDAARVIVESEPYLKLIERMVADDTDENTRRLLAGRAYDVVVASCVTYAPVGGAAQLAAGQLAAALADRNRLLRPAASAGLDAVKSFLPETDTDRWTTAWDNEVRRGHKGR